MISCPTVTPSSTDGSSVFFRIASNFNSLKTLTLLVHAGLSWCFHNPPNSDTDHRIFTMRMSSFCGWQRRGSWVYPNRQKMEGQVISYPTVTHNNTDGSSVFFRIASNFNSLKTLTLLVHAGLSWCFHNPPNSDTVHRIFTMRMSSFCLLIHTAPRYITQGST